MLVLTVDDSMTIRRIVRKSIDELGHEMLEAKNGAEALSLLADANNKIDLVILDWNMPGMNGIDVLKRIKAQPSLKHITVMMLTSESDRQFVLDAIKAGAQNYLTKPFDARMLNLKIQESLEAVTRARG